MLTIELRRVDALKPYGRRLRRYDHAIAQMVAVLREFGFKIPLLIKADGEVIDGHLRIAAADRMGMVEVPVVVCDDWSEAQIRAFRLTVNKSSDWAQWDWEALAQEIAALKKLDFDVSLTGFSGREVDEILQITAISTDIESPAEPSATPVSKPGDLWLCGNHRVLCGDSTSAADVNRLCGEDVPVAMITDPPYGVTYDPMWRQQAGLGEQRQKGKVKNDDRCDWTAAYALYRGDVIYCWHAGLFAAVVARGLKECGFNIHGQIIWVKQHFALSRGHYHWQHEPCWYAVRDGKSARWRGDRKQSTVWEISNLNPFGGDAAQTAEDETTGHGTQKPVELMRRPILNHTERGDIVYDPFLGSGSLLIASETTERRCYGLDIDPAYVDVIVQRWQKLTGTDAILDGDGRTFRQIADIRLGIDSVSADVVATVEGI